MMERTSAEFDIVVARCREVFGKKLKDYGPAWRILRPPSLTDQIYIKASRIRSIDEKGTQKVSEGIASEFTGIVNYSAIALIQLELGVADDDITMNTEEAIELFDKYISQAKALMLDKNHDYGEAWRNMRISSYTDIILMKLLRIKQIEDNNGRTFISEGVEAGYYDIINYALFGLIKLLADHNEKDS